MRIHSFTRAFSSLIKSGPFYAGISHKYTGLVFPGQGSQYPGMGKDLLEFAEARMVFEEMDEVCKKNITKLMFEGTNSSGCKISTGDTQQSFESLSTTEYTQPAVLSLSVAIYKVLESKLSLQAQDFGCLLGHSLGEFSALVVANSLSFKDAVKLVQMRGKFMTESYPPYKSGMIALMPTTPQQVSAVIDEVMSKLQTSSPMEQQHVCDIANVNTPSQVVISGTLDAIQQVAALAVSRKIARIQSKLDVSHAFHSKLMESTAEKLWPYIQEIHWSDCSSPVISNVTAKEITKGTEFPTLLKKHITHSVLWTQSIDRAVTQFQIKQFIEIGPGTVLSSLISKINKSVQTTSVGTVNDIRNFEKNFL